jgi:hypothetical protein
MRQGFNSAQGGIAMKSTYKMALVALSGAAFGAAAIHGEQLSD